MIKRKYAAALVPFVLAIAFFASCSSSKGKETHTETHWGYSGENGPDHWVSRGFVAAGLQSQSPINIVSSDTAAPDSSAAIGKPGYSYGPAAFEVVNNGHTIEMEAGEDGSNTLTLDNTAYSLKQFHFHAPSEHQLDGENFAMEVHLVHKDEAENIAVLGFFIKEGSENAVLKEAFEHLPQAADEKAHLENPIDLAALFDAASPVYRYDGSLTTPPCSEGVKWTVSNQVLEFSADQIAAFKSLYAVNNRPVQPLNSRVIYQVN